MFAESGGYLSDPQPGEIWCQRIKIVRELENQKVVIEISDEFGVLQPFKNPVAKHLVTIHKEDPVDHQAYIKQVQVKDITPESVIIINLNKNGSPVGTEKTIQKKQFIKDYHLPYF